MGQPGAIEDGGVSLTAWQQTGSVWSVGGVTAHGVQSGVCAAATPQCVDPEDLYVDGNLFVHASSLNAVGPGSYWIDYSAARLWIGTNPVGHDVALTVLPAAFSGSAPGVTIDNLTVRRYASPSQHGAIDATDAIGWSLNGIIADENHGSGIIIGDKGSVTNCEASDNGEQGLGGSGSDITINGCDIGGNNVDGYDPAWQAGGTKFSMTENLIVTRCYVHDNHGPGLWADESNENSTFMSNLVANNDGSGIFEEISDGARITGNTVLSNGRIGQAWFFGAGIEVASSAHVEVDHNYLDGNFNSIAGTQQARGSGRDGPHLLADLNVHDNTIVGGGPVALAQDTGDLSVFTSRNNRFQGNAYPATQAFSWLNHDGITQLQWQGYGEDTTGTFS